MIEPLARLLVPELRWDPGRGYGHLEEFIDEALELGVGGFILTGGPVDEVAELTAGLHRRSVAPLLIAAEVESGAGGRFVGATALPPFAALGALRDADLIRRAAKLTARELRTFGVNWALAPVADLARTGLDPVLGSRAFGDDAQKVAEWVVEWVDACQSEGVLACARHFPGSGRATVDASIAPATITASAATLWADDLLPFRGAVDAGVASVMVAPIAFPGLDPSGLPASHSRPLLRELLRDELHFEGLVVCDSSGRGEARGAPPETTSIVAAFVAGCDLVLAPADLHGACEALDQARADGTLDEDDLRESRHRRAFWADWGRSREAREATLDERLWARQVADTVIHAVRGVVPTVGPIVDLVLVDDDAGAPWQRQSREPFIAALRALGLDPRVGAGHSPDGRGALVIALFGEPAIGRGRAGYTESTRRRVAELVAAARQAQRTSVVLLFGPPRLAGEVPEAPNVLCCWTGDRAMQEAAARRLI